jgi:hypothetical protein
MRSYAALSLALAAGAVAQDATPVTGNPVGAVYKATLPEEPFFAGAAIEGNVKGYISAVSAPDGNGVEFTVHFENLPKEGGPFGYHLHAAAAVDGNCTSTKAHLDPFGRGQTPPCDSSAPNTCEVGDLSGKHGKITSDPFTATYTDIWASTREDSESFFGSRSFVIHYANTTRLTCANFEKKASLPPHSNSTSTAVATPTPSSTPSGVPSGVPSGAPSGPSGPGSTAPPPPPTDLPGAANAVYLSAPLMLAGLAAAAAFAL